jgi:hypothetical protein
VAIWKTLLLHAASSAIVHNSKKRFGLSEMLIKMCHTCFSKENQVQTYICMPGSSFMHAYSDI